MKKLLILGAMGLAAAAPAHAQQSKSMEQILRELEALNARVGKLEQDNVQLRTENTSLKESAERTEATSEYLKDNASATRKQLAQDSPKIAEAERITKAAEWASRLSWKADMRYRHEFVDPEEASDEQTRQRIRARLALTAKINDTLTGTIGLATNGGNSDPRSTNQTLGEGWTRKGIALDLAYVDWKPAESFSMSFRQDAAALVKGRRLLLGQRHHAGRHFNEVRHWSILRQCLWLLPVGTQHGKRRVDVRRPTRHVRHRRPGQVDGCSRLLRRWGAAGRSDDDQHDGSLYGEHSVLRRTAGQHDSPERQRVPGAPQ